MIIIIGILAAIAIPMFLNQREKAKDAGSRKASTRSRSAMQSVAVDRMTSIPLRPRMVGRLVGAALDPSPRTRSLTATPWRGTTPRATSTYEGVNCGRDAAYEDCPRSSADIAGAGDFVVR